MFPSRLFPPRLYPPRLFPELGAAGPSYPDLMAAVYARLVATVGAADPFPTVHADEADPETSLPFLLHSTADESPRRYFGGRIGEGTFEVGAFTAGYEASVSLMESARSQLDSWVNGTPVALGDGGSLFYLRSQEGTARSIRVPAPGGGVSHYGRTLQFGFKVTRPAQ